MDFEDQDEHEEEELHELHPPPPPSAAAGYDPRMPNIDAPPQRKPRYSECQKNHAVGLGVHAVDGCGEFLPAGPEGTLDALKCAACSCHRNFHRKETDTFSPAVAAAEGFNFSSPNHHQPHPHHHPPHHQPFLLPHHHPPHHQQFPPPYYRTPSGYLHVAPHQRPLALPSTSGGGGSREDQEDMSNPNNNNNNTSSGGGGGGGSGSAGKRFRTKFTGEQKEKMLELAEKLGWRIQKQDEEVIQQFCNETGVRRQVLKVWMHNNKHTLGKKVP